MSDTPVLGDTYWTGLMTTSSLCDTYTTRTGFNFGAVTRRHFGVTILLTLSLTVRLLESPLVI